MHEDFACPHCGGSVACDMANAEMSVACPFCSQQFQLPPASISAELQSIEFPAIFDTRTRKPSSKRNEKIVAPQSAWGNVSFIIAFVSCGWMLLAVVRALFDLGGGGEVQIGTIAWFVGAHLFAVAICLIGLALGIVALTTNDRWHHLAVYGVVGNAVPFVILLGLWSVDAAQRREDRRVETAKRDTKKLAPAPKRESVPVRVPRNRPPLRVPEDPFTRPSPPGEAPPEAQKPPAVQIPPGLRNAPNPDFGVIKLASGTELSYRDTSYIPTRIEQLFQDAKCKYVYVAKHENGDLTGACGVDQKGHLHGPAVSFHDNGHLAMLASFEDANRHGTITKWDENGRVAYRASFIKGRKDGLFCLFVQATPWLVQEWDNNKLQQQYLLGPIDFVDNNPVQPIVDGRAGDSAIELAIAKGALQTIEVDILEDENVAKRIVKEWYDENSDRMRKGIAAQTGTRKRRSILKRIDEIVTGNNSAFQEMWRNSLNRGGIR